MFVKGVSGNPSGKPKELQNVVMQARRMTPLVLRTLRRILLDEQASKQAKVAACQVVLDRGWGRAKQAIESDVTLHGDSLIEALDSISASNDLRQSPLTQASERLEQTLTSNN